MKILVIGGHGTIGRTLISNLAEKHDLIIAGRTSGDVIVDIADSSSIATMFETIGTVDAVVCVAGEAKWDLLDNLTEEDFYIGIRSKLMGQVNLVRIGKDHVSKGGSITLTTGVLADDPVEMTTSAAMVNGAIHSFLKAAVLEIDDVRINAVCAGLVEDAYEKYKDYFPGHDAVPMQKVVNGYLRSIEGKVNGEIIRVLA